MHGGAVARKASNGSLILPAFRLANCLQFINLERHYSHKWYF